MKKLLTDEKIWKKILIVYFILQPFLECYLLYTDQITSIFRFSPSTIIRIGIIGILFLLILFHKTDKNDWKKLFIYGILLVGYTIGHHISAIRFAADDVSNANYSVMTELLYIIRMLVPIMVAIITSKLNWTWQNFKKIILSTVGIISIVIVFMNVFEISLTSYGGDNIIKANFLSWFFPGLGGIQAEYLASRGWFYMANQISGLLGMLLPLTIYITITEFNNKKLIILFLQILAMILLGTRVAAVGWIAILAVMLIIYIFLCFVKKEMKFSHEIFLKLVVCGCIGAVILSFSPVMNRTYESDYFEQELAMKKKFEDESLNKDDKKPKSLYQKLSLSAINPAYYIQLYSYREHPEFWKDVLKLPFEERTGNRKLEVLVTKDIARKSNQPLEPWFGMSFSRMRNIEIYIEHDIIVHYYTIGIFGIMLFILPYFIILIWRGIGCLCHYKEQFNFLNISLLASVALALAISVFSGHLLDELIVTIFLGFVCGLLLKKDRSWREEDEEA